MLFKKTITAITPTPTKRKETERDVLYKVLVSLKKLQDNIKKEKEKSLELAKANNPEKVIISWGWEDVQSIRTTWDKKKCLEAMRGISKGLKDSMTEQGWECLGIAVDLWEGEKR